MLNTSVSRATVGNIAAFLCFVPYVSFFPLSSDIQPLALLAVVVYLIYTRKLKFNYLIIGFFSYTLVSLALVNSYSIVHPNQYFVLFLSYLSFPIICLFGFNYQGDLVKVLKYVLLFYLFFAFIQLISPSFFKNFISLIYNQKVIETGLRGWSSITPEPTDLAFTSSIIISMLLIKFRNSISNKNFVFTLSIALLLVAGSLGISGYLTSSLVFFMFFLTSKSSIITKSTLIFLFVLSAWLVIGLLEDLRVGRVISGLISEPLYIVSNTSLFYRVFENHLAIYYSYENSFIPSGFNSFYEAVKSIAKGKAVFLDFYSNRSEFINNYFNAPPEFAKNVFSRSLIENGFIFILGLVSLYAYMFFRFKMRVLGIFLVVFTLYLAQSFPLYYPPIWFSLGYLLKKYS